ncbi:MAG: YggT family protein [Thermodesulfobacteriota bacterium]
MSGLVVLGHFVQAFAGVLNVVLTIYMWIVIIAALISWVNPDPYNPIVRFLYSMTEPVFSFVRRRLPLPRTRIDISPFIVWLAIVFLQIFLVQTLNSFAQSLLRG